MICDDCGEKNAVIHMTKVVQGKKEELHLCETCAKKRENTSMSLDFSIHNFLANFLDNNLSSKLNISSYQGIQCPHCNTTLTQFKESGRLGCDACYQAFSESINPLIRRIHGNTNHVGKLPKRGGEAIQLKLQVNDLKSQLRLAIESEAFEQAAEIRDQLKRVEEQIKSL